MKKNRLLRVTSVLFFVLCGFAVAGLIMIFIDGSSGLGISYGEFVLLTLVGAARVVLFLFIGIEGFKLCAGRGNVKAAFSCAATALLFIFIGAFLNSDVISMIAEEGIFSVGGIIVLITAIIEIIPILYIVSLHRYTNNTIERTL